MKIKDIKKYIQETIKEVISNELIVEAEKIGMGKAYRLKEELMQAVQNGIRSRVDLIHSQDEYENAVDEELEKLRSDIDLTFSMIGRTLYQIPYQAFKQEKNTNQD